MNIHLLHLFCIILSLLCLILKTTSLLSLNNGRNSSQRCEQRIIGGQDAYAGQFPYAAALNIQTENGRYFCSGSLVGLQWVLTAGHCVLNATLITIHLGSTTLTESDPNRVTLASSDYILHPDFNPETIEHALGLIRLRMPITWSTYLNPIYSNNQPLLSNTRVAALGWGQTSDSDSALSEHLKFAYVTVISNAECQITYGDQITENMACVVGNYNEGTCTGDNGGPLVEFLSRSYWLVGIASFVSGNGCESTDPSGYTKTYAYDEWIQNITNN